MYTDTHSPSEIPAYVHILFIHLCAYLYVPAYTNYYIHACTSAPVYSCTHASTCKWICLYLCIRIKALTVRVRVPPKLVTRKHTECLISTVNLPSSSSSSYYYYYLRGSCVISATSNDMLSEVRSKTHHQTGGAFFLTR